MANTDTMPLVQRFWNKSADKFDAIYTGEKSAIHRRLDRVFRKDMYDRFDWVMRHSECLEGKTICDIGCGSGRFVAEFARRGVARAVGVDVAPKMLSLATQLVASEGLKGTCEFIEADILDWHVQEKFDVTTAIGVWDYIANPAARLARIRAITDLKFLSTWPRLWTWRMPLRKMRLGLANCPVYFFRRSQVIRLLADARFRVERIDTIGKLFCVDARPV